MNAILTVFTPTYNRCHLLPKLYHSLCEQTLKDFIWLVVDDGSSDNTQEIVDIWKREKNISIEYVRQVNQGKSEAFNTGIKATRTEVFTCVDSDDYLIPDAVEIIINEWDRCKNECIGILCLREVSIVPENIRSEIFDTTLIDAYRVYGLCGDTMLIHKSEFLKKYEFPKYPGEKFVPEDYLYDKLDQDGKMRFLNKVLYRGTYIEGGYTRHMAKLIKDNPQGYNDYITQRLKIDKTLKYKILDTIKHIAIKKVLDAQATKIPCVYPLLHYVLYPFGVLLYILRYKNI